MTSIHLHQYVEQVDKLIDDNRLVEAIEHCRHILHSYPRHIDTYRVMGKALLEKQEYDDASDLFLRILGADPNDFISHVGLSIIYKEESQFDQALWHLERAFEIQPYNVAIQGELRQLYAVEAETRPGIIPLTRGALARLYMQGELYQQAISELRRILEEEPGRMDLQVLLAEALWRDDQRIDAEEVCLNVLEELPNCIVLNAILAEIWLQTGRIPEAQKYLHRLHGLTQQTQKSLDKETIAGQAFATEGAFPLPEQASLDFLQTGTVIPEEPAKPTVDWVDDVPFEDVATDEDSLEQVVLEPESGMHSYDWLADIEELDKGENTAVSDDISSETDWFSEDKAKESLNLSTGELDAEWLADLRGEEAAADADFQPLDLEGVVDEPVGDQADSETDWVASEDVADKEVAAVGDDAAAAPVEELDSEEESFDWLAALTEEPSDSQIEIDATNLMDDSLTDWAESESEPHVVQEPKTPFWLSEMADEEMDAVQLDPEDALDWMNEPVDDLTEVDEVELQEDNLVEDAELELEIGPTAVLDPEDQADAEPAPTVSETDSLGDAEDWLAALTESGIDEEIAEEIGDNIALDESQLEEEIEPASRLQVEATTEELAALSDAEDWLESAAADLDEILKAEEIEEEEFPNLAIPELEGDDITNIPDWLNNENLELSEESEAAVSSENDPQETPQSEEPEVEPTGAQESDEPIPDALDWLADLTSDSAEEDAIPPEPPIETEGMPSWLNDLPEDTAVEVVDEWDSASADIPDWLQEPVELADLDNEDALVDEKVEADAPGLTGLLSEMDVADEALPLDQMDSLLSDWVDEDSDDGLTGLLGGFEVEEETRLAADEPIIEDAVAETADPPQPEEPAEIGLTGLLSNLTLEDDEIADADGDFLAEVLEDAGGDDLGESFFEETPELETETDTALGLSDLDKEDVSLTELLSDITSEEEGAAAAIPAVPSTDDDMWLDDFAELAEPEAEAEVEPEPEAEEEVGLTGMLANLWPDEEEAEVAETAVSATDDPLQDLDDQPTDDIGLTELLAGIDYEEDAIESDANLEEFAVEPTEPSLTEVLTEMEAEVESEPEPEVEELPVSAEDTTWLDQLEADTGNLREEADEFDLAEETGLDWLTTPDEPAAEIEEAEPEEVEAEDVDEGVVIEPDSAPEDWDDAMSWLEELAAQQDEPVEELPSVAETMLDEELDTAEELRAAKPMDGSDLDWLDDLTGDVGDTDSLDSIEEIFEETKPELPEISEMVEEETMPELGDLVEDEEVSWLDELATDMLDGAAVDEAETAVEPVAEAPELEPEDHAWLEELTTEDEVETAVADELPELDTLAEALDETDVLADLETAVDDAELSWLDAVTEEEEPAELDEAISESDLDEALLEGEDEIEPLAKEEMIVTGVTDALKEDSGIEEAEADLEEALAWLDELDEADEADLLLEAPPTQVTPIEEGLELESDDEPETVILTPEPDELTVALDRLEQQVMEEGVTVPETAVSPVTLSTDELNAALDWIEQAEAAPAQEETEAEPIVEPIAEVDEVKEVTEEAAVAEEDDIDLAAMSDDPEAWLEELLTDDLDMDVEMEPPPIKPSEDAMFVTDATTDEEQTDATEVDEAEEIAAPVEEKAEIVDVDMAADEAAEVDSLLDDVALDGMPDDPDAAVAWLDQMVSGDDALDIEMEPPPIKPSEDAMFVTDDVDATPADKLAAEVEEEIAVEADIADDVAELDLGDMEEDPEALLEQLLSGEMTLDVDMEPPPIKPSKDAVYVTEDTPEADNEQAIEVAQETQPELPAAADVTLAEVDAEPAVEDAADVDELDFDDMLDDPEALLEQLLGDDLDVEIEPPPIKPSEDAVYVTDDDLSDEDVSAEADDVADAVSETELATAEQEQSPDSEPDIIADVPDDPDEAMVWLEQLAARQGAAIDELPTVSDPEAEPVMPSWMAEDLEELAAEPDLELADDVADTVVSPQTPAEGTVPDEDVESEMPEWLEADADDALVGETGWLRSLPEVDVETWLTAEEEATASGPLEDVAVPDTGPLTAPPQAPPPAELDDDLFEPVMEPSTGAYSVDEAKLTVAQTALADGRLDEAIVQFKELVTEGSGMMAIIAELEQAADVHPQAPALFQVLGDAYMRNGQLQKALTSYRAALDQM